MGDDNIDHPATAMTSPATGAAAKRSHFRHNTSAGASAADKRKEMETTVFHAEVVEMCTLWSRQVGGEGLWK